VKYSVKSDFFKW